MMSPDAESKIGRLFRVRDTFKHVFPYLSNKNLLLIEIDRCEDRLFPEFDFARFYINDGLYRINLEDLYICFDEIILSQEE